MKYRIRSIKWPKMIIEDGFSSVSAACQWAKNNMHYGGIWNGGWYIESYKCQYKRAYLYVRTLLDVEHLILYVAIIHLLCYYIIVLRDRTNRGRIHL